MSGILSQASDWKLRADFDNQITVPVFLTPTTLRPDLVIYSKAKKKVIIIELTCCCEQNFTSWHSEKYRKYKKEMIPNIVSNGWHVDFFAIEVGARGYCSTTVKSCLFALGFSHKRVRDALQRIGKIALECSFHIWLCRNTPKWTFDNEFLWDSFRNPVDITKPKPIKSKVQVLPESDSAGNIVDNDVVKPQQSQDPIYHNPPHSDRYTKINNFEIESTGPNSNPKSKKSAKICVESATQHSYSSSSKETTISYKKHNLN